MTTAPTPLPHRSTHRGGRMVAAVALVAAGAAGAGLVLIGRAVLHGSSTTHGVTGSGHPVAQARPVRPFGALDLAGSVPLQVRVGPARSVVVHADDNLVSRVTTHVLGGRLVVGTRPGSFEAKAPMYVEVTTPTLSTLTLSGSGVVSVDGIDGRRLALHLPGSGVLRASGRVERLDVTLTGSGEAQLMQLGAREVHASVGGSGMIAVTATERLDALVSGSGAILYRGNPPHVLTSVTGSGAITPAG